MINLVNLKQRTRHAVGNHGPHLLGGFHWKLLEIVLLHMQNEVCVLTGVYNPKCGFTNVNALHVLDLKFRYQHFLA